MRPVEKANPPPVTATIASLALRAGLLFVLGIGYGMLVTRFHKEQYLASVTGGIISQGYNWKYLAFWGASGVILGALLPWCDRLWEDAFGGELDEAVEEDGRPAKASGPTTDWALVVRAIGAFVGIMFAIVSNLVASGPRCSH